MSFSQNEGNHTKNLDKQFLDDTNYNKKYKKH